MVESLGADIEALSGRVRDIGDITAAVSELSDRSNLLALNASIEAARAGEHGRGFAVVAGEVRRLAEQSAESTARVQEIVDEVRHATDAAVAAARETASVVDEATALAESTAELIQGLADGSDATVARIRDLAAAADRQHAEIDETASEMAGVYEGAAEVTSATGQTESVAERLRALAGALDRLTAGDALAEVPVAAPAEAAQLAPEAPELGLAA
jgi:methyl-accepting chemotaxis protein